MSYVQEIAASFGPGVTEFGAAVVGAIVGSLFGGLVSWKLQAASFKNDADVRSQEKKAQERALLLQTMYAVMKSASDLHKLQEQAEQAMQRSTPLQPSPPGLNSRFLALLPTMNLPEPIAVRPEAITVMVDHGEAGLAMATLDVVAVHEGALKTWVAYVDSRRRFNEKFPVKLGPNGETQLELTSADVERHYPLLKELSDLAEGICETSRQQADDAKALVDKLGPFIERATGTKLSVTFPQRDKDPAYLSGLASR